MKVYKIALFDQDEEFVLALMNYLNRGTQIPILSVAFTGTEDLKEYIGKHKVDLIISQNLSESFLHELKQYAPLLVSYDAGEIEYAKDCQYIYRYSKASVYVQQIMKLLSQQEGCVDSAGNGRNIAVYSPLGRCGKTYLSHALCKHFSKQNKGKVLYFGMEEYGANSANSMNSTYGNETYRMEDFLYYVKQRNAKLSLQLKSIVDTSKQYDVFPSALTYEEYRELNQEDLKWMLHDLSREGMYDYIIYDIGTASLSDIRMLREFDVVYMPCLQDSDSINKWHSFMKALERKQIEQESRSSWYMIPIGQETLNECFASRLEANRISGTLMSMNSKKM